MVDLTEVSTAQARKAGTDRFVRSIDPRDRTYRVAFDRPDLQSRYVGVSEYDGSIVVTINDNSSEFGCPYMTVFSRDLLSEGWSDAEDIYAAAIAVGLVPS
jgi:hypothetical protein